MQFESMEWKLFLFLLVLLPLKGLGQVYTGAVSAAAGGTGRASVDSGVGNFLNPAMLVHQRGQQVYTAFQRRNFALAYSDNTRETPVPSGLSYWQKQLELEDSGIIYSLKDFRLTFAEMFAHIWAVGFTVHYYQVQGQDRTWGSLKGDLGFMVSPHPNFGLAAVVYDLGSKPSDAPESLWIRPKVGLGFNHVFRDYFRSRLDIVSGPEDEFGRFTVMAGVESYMNKWVITRFGYQENQYSEQYVWSLGFGFDLPRFRLNYALRSISDSERGLRTISVAQNNEDKKGEVQHLIDLAIPF